MIWSALVLLLAGSRHARATSRTRRRGRRATSSCSSTVGLSAVLYLGLRLVLRPRQGVPAVRDDVRGRDRHLRRVRRERVGGARRRCRRVWRAICRAIVDDARCGGARRSSVLVGSVSLRRVLPARAAAAGRHGGRRSVTRRRPRRSSRDQLARVRHVDRRAAARQRAGADRRRAGADRQVQRLPVPGVPPDLPGVQGILAKYQRSSPAGAVRDEGLSARARVQRRAALHAVGVRSGGGRAAGARRRARGPRWRSGFRQPGDDDARRGEGGRARGRAGHRLRRAVPEGARAGEGGRRAGPDSSACRDADVLHQRHQDQRRRSGRSIFDAADRARAEEGLRQSDAS